MPDDLLNDIDTEDLDVSVPVDEFGMPVDPDELDEMSDEEETDGLI